MSAPGTEVMGEAMMAMADMLKVAFDAADGLRTDLTGRGYTAAGAESVAIAFLQGIVAMATRGGT